MPRSGAIPFPRFAFALDHAAWILDSGFWALGTLVPVPVPHGPETLNTGQGNIRSVMSQTGYYSVNGGVWMFQGIPRSSLLEHMCCLILYLLRAVVCQCTQYALSVPAFLRPYFRTE